MREAPDLPGSALEQLPDEVLETICWHLRDHFAGLAYLDAFASTSPRCWLISAKERHRRLTIRVGDDRRTSAMLNHLTNIPVDDQHLGHIREIVITSRLLQPDSFAEIERIRNGRYLMHEELFEPELLEGDTIHGHHREPPLCLREQTFRSVTPEGGEPWSAVVRLLERIRRITDLVFEVNDRFPLTLLDALHAHHPTCRLHVPNIALTTLVNADHYDLMDGDVRLVTSPCLYSIGVKQRFFLSNDRFSYTRDALLQMLSGASPNLRHIYVIPVLGSFGHTYDLRHRRRQYYSSQRPTPRNFFKSDQCPQVTPGILSSFIWNAVGSVPVELEEWTRVIDFPQLKSLRIHDIDIEVLQALISVASASHMQLLQRLDLELNTDFLYEDTSDASFAALLRSLSPLSALRLGFDIGEETLSSIFDYHGLALRELALRDWEYSDPGKPAIMSQQANMDLLVRKCPNLVDLEASLRRTGGTEQEVRLYQTLRHLSQLQRLSLMLRCLTVEDTCSDDPPLPAKIARSHFIDTACDQKLTTAIFNTIYGERVCPRRQYQSLKTTIWTEHHAKSGYVCDRPELADLTRWIARSWLLQRKFEAGIEIKELDGWSRKQSGSSFANDMKEAFKEHGHFYRKIWISLWPRCKGNWKQGWESIPLWSEKEEH